MSFTIGPMHQVHNQAQPLSLKSGTSSSVWISNWAAWKTGSASSFSLSLIFTFTAGKVTFYRQSMYASLFTQKIIRVAFCWIILSRDADSLISAVIICFRRTTELQAILGCYRLQDRRTVNFKAVVVTCKEISDKSLKIFVQFDLEIELLRLRLQQIFN